MRKLFYKVMLSLVLAIVMLVLLAGIALAAWEFVFPIAVVDSGGTARTYVPVLTGVTGSSLSSAGYIDSDGTDTNMQIGTTDAHYMMSTTQIATVAPSIGAYSRINYDLYTGYTPAQTAFSIIVGHGGYITVSDDADLEPGDDFEIEFDGYVDTDSGSDKNLINKDSALLCFIAGDETIVAGMPEYEEVTTQNDVVLLYSGSNTRAGEKVSSFSGIIYKVQFNLMKTGSPTGTLTCNIRDATTDSILGTFGTLDVSTLTDSYAWYSFDDIQLELSSTDIRIAVEYDGGNITNCVRVGRYTSGATSSWGILSYYSGSWTDDATDDADYKVNFANPAVIVSSISSGEHTVNVYADGSNLGIIVDEGEAGETSDTVALSGASVTDNGNDWLLDQNDVLPYFDYYKHTVSDTLIAWYQPTGMITATTLPDRQGDAENGTITWGSNSNLTVTMGTVESYESSTAEVAGDEVPGFDVPGAEMPTGWYGGDITSLPFYDNFSEISTNTGIPVATIYTWSIYGVAIAVGFGTFIVFKPMLIGFLSTLGVLWAGSSMGVVPGWVIFSFIILGLGIIYVRRSI